MGRWHKQGCNSPDICITPDSTPRCRACGATAHIVLRDLLAAKCTSRLQIPQEDFNSLSLRWPSCVSYKAVSEPKLQQPLSRPSDGSPEVKSRNASYCDNPAIAKSGRFVYEERLSPDQVRLAVLSAVPFEARSQPIHLCLETHFDKRAPDYDAVSYTWGGENDDSRLCVPIYVGDYWDIILQTENCSSMLRYLRPLRGIRILWIDAVCINQSDDEERSAQVAKMKELYSQSSQVWVWLGDDLVCNDSGDPPERLWLHELETTSIRLKLPSQITTTAMQHHHQPTGRISIATLLQRRYFSRVWVIQELLLAPRVLIPIADKLLRADHTTSAKLQKIMSSNRGFQWSETQAPWLMYMTRGFPEDFGVWEIMSATSKSQASDFRDKLFGVVGLFHSSNAEIALRPDYSISVQHTVIGFLAYCVAVERQLQLFYLARGRGSAFGPSWLPPWEEQQSWERIFKRPMEASINIQDLDNAVVKDIDKSCQNIAQVQEHNLSEDGKTKGFYVGIRFQIYKGISMRRVTSNPVFNTYPWNRDISVNSNTKGLSVWLMRLTAVNSKPTRVYNDILDGMMLYKFGQSLTSSIYIASRYPLEEIVQENDEIFILNPGRKCTWTCETDDPNGLIYMVLRRIQDHTYEMVTCSPYLCIITPDYLPYPSLGRICTQRIHKLQESLAQSMVNIRCWLNGSLYKDFLPSGEDSFLCQAFPGHRKSSRWILFSYFVGKKGVEDLYHTQNCRSPITAIVDGYLQHSFEPRDWTVDRHLYLDFKSNLRWEWYNHNCTWEGMENRSSWGDVKSSFCQERIVRIRCPLSHIEDGLGGLSMAVKIGSLWESGVLGNDLDAFKSKLEVGPAGEDLLKPTPIPTHKASHLRKRLGLDCGSYQVDIV